MNFYENNFSRCCRRIEAVESARFVGIVSYYYNNKEKDLEKLKSFLDENIH